VTVTEASAAVISVALKNNDANLKVNPADDIVILLFSGPSTTPR
jgi:hypothetical protein